MTPIGKTLRNMEIMMKTNLLAGVSALVLALGWSSVVQAQSNNANDNDPWTAITQDSNSDAVAGALNAVEDGAIAGAGNAIGEFSDDNAAASDSSTALDIDTGLVDAAAAANSVAVDDGGAVKGNGAALGQNAEESAIAGEGLAVTSDRDAVNDGSALHYGDGNGSATANDDSAAANNSSVALNADDGDIASEGSSVVVGDNNTTASADDGGAAVGADGTAVGIHDVFVGGGNNGLLVNGGEGGGWSDGDATVAFGIDNTVASAHLDSFVSGLAIAITYGENGDYDDNHTSIATGSIFNNEVSSASGANRVVFNTGIANQGRALSIAANTSFGD